MEGQNRVEREAVQLTLYVAEPHLRDRRCRVDELLSRAAAAGASGATVLAAYHRDSAGGTATSRRCGTRGTRPR
jgi:PII-like signaling protein